MQDPVTSRRVQFSSCDQCRSARVRCDARQCHTSSGCTRCRNRGQRCTFEVWATSKGPFHVRDAHHEVGSGSRRSSLRDLVCGQSKALESRSNISRTNAPVSELIVPRRPVWSDSSRAGRVVDQEMISHVTHYVPGRTIGSPATTLICQPLQIRLNIPKIC